MSDLKILNVFLNDRSDLTRIVSVSAEGRFTRADEIDRAERDGTFRIWRSDIALVNLTRAHCETCTCDSSDRIEQRTVSVTTDGSLYGDGMQYLNDDQLDWCRQEAQRMVQIAAVYPAYGKAMLLGF